MKCGKKSLDLTLSSTSESLHLSVEDDLASLAQVEDWTVEHPGAPGTCQSCHHTPDVIIMWSPDKLGSPDDEGGQVRGQGAEDRARQGLQHRDQGVSQHLGREGVSAVFRTNRGHLTHQERDEHEGNVQQRQLLCLGWCDPGMAPTAHTRGHREVLLRQSVVKQLRVLKKLIENQLNKKCIIQDQTKQKMLIIKYCFYELENY